MLSSMMDFPLTITSIMRHASRLYRDVEIVSVSNTDDVHRYNFGDAFDRVAKLANALKRLGVEHSDCIGTLAWNDHRHLEVYYAVSCMGAVCHTINPRLFQEQLAYIINHAEDRWLFIDASFVPLLEALADQLSAVAGYIVLSDKENMPATNLANVVCYETLIEDEPAEYPWPELDENTASSLCYTSGTTGNPKGVVYSHRSTVLHSMVGAMPGNMALSASETIMPVVPMFHVNAWGLPYTAAMVGAKLVLPGPKMGDSEMLCKLITEEKVTVAAAVPTVWQSLLAYLESTEQSVPTLARAVVGGAACPHALMQSYEDKYGVYMQQGWGMTELSPLGSIVPIDLDGDSEAAWQQRRKAGKPIFGVELKIIDQNGDELPWDGQSAGALQARGPWVCSRYFKAKTDSAHDSTDWFDTGDIATIDPQGYVQITDRIKDVIKSGGEWISSIELELIALEHPAVAEAAVIAVAHPKWNERPLLCVVTQPDAEWDKEAVLNHFHNRVAKWWIPDDCVLLDSLPRTATGKVSKKDLRMSLSSDRPETRFWNRDRSCRSGFA